MSPPIARATMSLANRIAPADRANWSAAMRQEFEALDGGPDSLSWALGCLASALGWRARTEIPYVAMLGAACLATFLVRAQAFFAVVDWTFARGQAWFGPMALVDGVLMGGLSFAMAFAWPRRASLTALVVLLTWGFGGLATSFWMIFQSDLAAPWVSMGSPELPRIAWSLVWLARESWPGLLGAALGWAMARYRGHRARLHATI